MSTSPGDLSPQELVRYGRHITLGEVGVEGQKKLKSSRVLLIGSGGLGSPLALYLAAAGVGTIGIVDFDVVDESNLQRQVLHGTATLGVAKTESAFHRLKDINPYVRVETHPTRLSSENALELIESYQIVVDGTDNFPTRYLVNDACVFLDKPNVYGSVFRFAGQVSVFYPNGGGPCYRCLYPEPPPFHLVPSCAEGGVLGILPGIIGTLQANEVIKIILGIGESLQGKLLSFDALKASFQEFKVPRDPQCALCGSAPTITELKEYAGTCPAAQGTDEMELDPVEFLKQWEEGSRPHLIDVREPYEWEIANLADYGARLWPLGSLSEHLSGLPKASDVVVYCKSGGRSARAQRLFTKHGFEKVRNLAGGIQAWTEKIDPSLRSY